MMAMDHQGIMGLDITGYGNYGWATTTPVKTLADAKKVKFRTAEAAVNQMLYQQWGLNAVVMPWPDVPVALKQGVITGLDHTPAVCNITKKFEVCKYYTFIVYIIQVILSFFGCFGNALTSWLLWSDRKKSATFYLLLCIVICDSFFLVVLSSIAIPYHVLQITAPTSKKYTLARVVHYFYMPGIHQSLLTCKVYLTIMVSLQRYFSTCHPLKAKEWGTVKIARGQLIASVVIAILIWFPYYFDNIFFIDSGYPRQIIIFPRHTYKVILLIYQSLFLYAVPMLSLAIMSFLLLRGLKEAHKRRAALNGEENRKAKQSFGISIMIAILMLMVLVNQAVIPIRRILALFYVDTKIVACDSIFFFYDPWIPTVQVITASMSFFLCLLTSKKYRKRTLAAFRRPRTRNSVAPSGNSLTEPHTHARSGSSYVD
jgi:hypothetical protein